MKIKNDQLIELNRWLRSESPLTEFARSLRMEGPASAGSSGGGQQQASDNHQQQQQQVPGNQQQQAPADPYTGIDLDELDPDVRKVLEDARTKFVGTQTELQKATAERDRLDKAARAHQARADQNHEILRRHNLVPDPSGRTGGPDTDAPENNPVYQDILKRFVAKGIDPKIAAVHATLAFEAGQVHQQHFVKGMQPLAGQVLTMEARQVLESLRENTEEMQNEEIAKDVQENIETLVKNGTQVTPEIAGNLLDMAYGRYLRAHPELFQSSQAPEDFSDVIIPGITQTKKPDNQQIVAPQNQQQAQPRNFRRGGSTGGGYGGGIQRSPSAGAPTPKNRDTAVAIAATVTAMRQGLPDKAKKGGK